MKRCLVVTLCLLVPLVAFGSTVTYSDQASFFAAVGTKITDNYTNPNYVFVQSDAVMTAVLNETRYETTTFLNNNIVFGAGPTGFAYCAGCNGGFNLFFDSTSVGTSSGVYGVGFLIGANSDVMPAYDLVTFGDGSQQLYALPRDGWDFSGYFGITSDKLIKEMSFVDANGQVPPQDGWYMAITSLTIAQEGGVPEPATLALLGTGLLGGLGGLRRKANL